MTEPHTPSAVANATAIVMCTASTRFTVMTPRLIRAEYSSAGVFENRPTLTILRRNLPVPKFDMANGTDGWCNISVYDEHGAVSVDITSASQPTVIHNVGNVAR